MVWNKDLEPESFLFHSQELNGIQPNNYGQKMPAPIASLGRNQLKKIDHYNQLRIRSAKIWDRWCDDNHYKKPLIIPDSKPVYLRYPVLVEHWKKKNRIWAQKTLGVQVGEWFKGKTHPVDEFIINCPNSDLAVQKCINFPKID